MTTKTYLTSLSAVFGVALSAAGPAYAGEIFVQADNPKEAVAGCLVATVGSDAALATCFCEATDFGFEFCGGGGGAGGGVAVGVAEAFALSGTRLVGNVSTFRPFNDIKIDVHGSCTLQDEMFVGNINLPGDPFEIIAGETARYSAVYMWPSVDGRPVADPVRLCARGTETELVTAFPIGSDASLFEFESVETDFGMTGGFSWVAENQRTSYRGHRVAANFIVVAAVENELLQAFGNDVVAVGVATSAKLKDRVMHAEAKNLIP